MPPTAGPETDTQNAEWRAGLPWWDAGFESLVSILPPDAVIAPNSTLTEKVRGKAPGLLGPNGWTGYDWTRRTPTRDNVAAWQGGIGLRTDGFPAVDIDVLDPGLADAIEQITRDLLGPAPCRTGRAPKRLLLYRTETPMPKRRLVWSQDGEVHAVEVLGRGSQCVVEGRHATTGLPYTWAAIHPVRFGARLLAPVTPEQIDRLFTTITEYLSMFGYLTVESCESATERHEVAQEQLAGDPDTVAQVVRSLPNPAEMTRDDYLRVGYAIKAALPASQDDAYDLWVAWAERWEGGVNEAVTLEADWHRMKPPFEIGASYLYDLAAKHGDTRRVEAYFTFEDAPLHNSNAEILSETAVVSDTETGVVKFTDAWLAHRFVEQHGAELRYCPGLGGWLYWDSVRWRQDDLDLVGSWAARIGRQAASVALAEGETPSDARATSRWCNSERAVRQLLAYASRHPRIATRVEAFDVDPWLLNTPNGVVNLKNGVLEPHTTALLVTKCTSVGPSAAPPVRWLELLAEVTRHDVALQTYLQRLFGYALTGVTSEEMLAFFWGSGGNGKGTLLKAVCAVLGTYAATASMETFTASKYDRHPADLAALAGTRLVVAQETQEGRSWDETKIKALTGGDPVTARFMRQNFFTYQPQFKLIFAGNHRPNLDAADAAMRRRFHLVPFDFVPAHVDTHLKDRLLLEYPGVLAWMIEGCRQWVQSGLGVPPAVLESTHEYFREADPVGRWIEERCDVVPTANALTQDLFTGYRHWCLNEGEDCLSLRKFAQAIRTHRGVETWRHPVTKCRGIRGLRLREGALDARVRMLGGELPAESLVPATQH